MHKCAVFLMRYYIFFGESAKINSIFFVSFIFSIHKVGLLIWATLCEAGTNIHREEASK